MRFETKEEAIAYCERHGIAYQVFETHAGQARAHLVFGQFRLYAAQSLDALRGGGPQQPWPTRRPCTAGALAAPCRAGGLALLEQRNEAFLGHRLAEQKALAVIATHADQRQRVGRLLDADGDRDAAEIVRQIDHGLAQGGCGETAPAGAGRMPPA